MARAAPTVDRPEYRDAWGVLRKARIDAKSLVRVEPDRLLIVTPGLEAQTVFLSRDNEKGDLKVEYSVVGWPV